MDSITSPADLRCLGPDQLDALADELRAFLVASVSRTGGHLGPNLGVVELTIALHRVFDSPTTPLVFDTGHQAYVHKLLTGRQQGFAGLRTRDGLSGYPQRAESVHDVVENSHASTALSYADGLSKAFRLAGDPQRCVVALVGDGAMTGGLCWEALNTIGASRRRVVVVLNDNGCSYAPTVGGLPRHLARLGDRPGYERLVAALGDDGAGDPAEHSTPADGGTPGPQNLFASLGLGYIGPVDGHDLPALEAALTQARGRRSPVVVHVRTTKGNGYTPALRDTADHMHAVGAMDPGTGRPRKPRRSTWTDAFADALVTLGGRRSEVVAVGAAMLGPTGLQRFADRFPGRCFDVGIAEQHAVTSAAGLAMGGMHPVVALYATFANRAFDQLLMDAGLHRLPVTLVLDRAGITGEDGASHHGMWDLALLAGIPGMRVAAPRDAGELETLLDEAVATTDGPTALRFPKAALGPAVPALGHAGSLDVLRRPARADVLLVAVGAMATTALVAADLLAVQGVECTVVDPRWVLPVDPAVVDLAAAHRHVVVLEDGVRDGGVGSRVAARVADAGAGVPVHCIGLPVQYLPHGSREELLVACGMDPGSVAGKIARMLAHDGEGAATRASTDGLHLVPDSREEAI